jgi:mRNA-degrading endonuclease RelE of RelBE toxin-antitoxin system
MPEPSYRLDQPAVEALLALDDATAARLLIVFEMLVENPSNTREVIRHSEQGHPVFFRRVDDLDVVYYRQPAKRRVVILDIQKYSG